jgi:SAM-dependent methyltransferase
MSRSTERLLIPPIAVLARPAVRLFLTSTALLFVELLLIRWIPANVVYVSYFSNFLLIASFLGIGLGIIFGRASSRLLVSPFTPLLFALVALVLTAQLNIQFDPGEQVFHGLNASNTADANFLVLPVLMLLVVALMTTLAMPLGGLLRAMPPLRAYAIDITGSLTGIAAFGLMSAFELEPLVWFAFVAVLLVVLALGRGVTAWSAVPALSMLGVLLLAWRAGMGPEVWSPYYRINGFDATGPVALDQPGNTNGIVQLYVNGIPHQSMVDADASAAFPLHGQVYRWFPDRSFSNVLIVGAGSGTDVALALARGAGHIDAVEIDPRIVTIGRTFHPDRPYDDPRVSAYVDDGRAFLRRTTNRYDLILFALTDSLTLVTSTGNIRLESFLFTQEAFASARDHLTPNGVFAMYNYYREPWLVTKLDGMATSVFGYEPLLRLDGSRAAVMALGPGVAQAMAASRIGDRADQLPSLDGTSPTYATDDWPFLYLRSAGVAPYYLAALAVLLGFAVVAVATASRVSKMPLRSGFSPHFFVLGIAFLLLETRSIVTFSLLFGTTWSINALVFFAILLSVLVAIVISARFPVRRPVPLYLGLVGTLALAWLLPPEQLLIDPPALRYALASAVAFAPIVFANLIFANSFRDTMKADMAFASNLIGAMVGGALEYVALLTGYRALLLLVAGLYVLAYLFATRWRVLADRDLEAAAVPDQAIVRPSEAAT